MSTSPRNDSHYPKLCRLRCTPITNTPSKVPIFSCFGTCKTPCAEIQTFFNGLRMCAHKFTSFNSKNCSKSEQDKWPKVRVVLVTEKQTNTFWRPQVEPLLRFPLLFCVSTHRDRHTDGHTHTDTHRHDDGQYPRIASAARVKIDLQGTILLTYKRKAKD